jgi:hypothetical protein
MATWNRVPFAALLGFASVLLATPASATLTFDLNLGNAAISGFPGTLCDGRRNTHE